MTSWIQSRSGLEEREGRRLLTSECQRDREKRRGKRDGGRRKEGEEEEEEEGEVRRRRKSSCDQYILFRPHVKGPSSYQGPSLNQF